MSNNETPPVQSKSSFVLPIILSVLIIEAILMIATAPACGNGGLCTLRDFSSDLFITGILAIVLVGIASGAGADPDRSHRVFWGKPLPLPVNIDTRPKVPFKFGIFLLAGVIAGLLAIVLSILMGFYSVGFASGGMIGFSWADRGCREDFFPYLPTLV